MFRRSGLATAFVSLLATSALGPAQAGGAAGIWVAGPTTDRSSSLAMAGDPATGGEFMVLRCKNGDVDIFVEPGSKEPPLTVGARQEISIRFDKNEPIAVSALATEPTKLVIDHRGDKKILLRFMTARTVTVYGRHTMRFAFVWHPANALSVVGRVLADCGVIPRDQWEADVAKSLENSPGSTSTKKK